MLIIFIELLEKKTTNHSDKMKTFNEKPCFCKHSSKLFFFVIRRKLIDDTMRLPILCTPYAMTCNLNASIDPVLLSSDV